MVKYKNLSQTILFAFIGIVIGVIILKSYAFPSRWTIAIAVGLLCFFAGMIFINCFERIIYACFILFLPLQLGKSFFYVPYAGGGHELRINLPEIFFSILLFIWSFKLVQLKRRPYIDRTLLISSGFFLIISFLSLIHAENFYLGFFELIRAIIAFLIFLFVADYVDSEKKINNTIILLLLGGSIQIIFGLYQWNFKQDLGLYFFGEMGLTPEKWAEEPIVRVGGLIGHPNAFATYLTIILPFCITFLLKDRKMIIKIASLVYLIAGMFALIATQSRGGWLGFGIAFILSFSIFLITSKKFHLRLWPYMLMLIISLSVIGFLSYDVIEKRILIDDRGSAAARIPMMIDALNVIEDNPLLGVGMNNYALVIHTYDKTGIHREWQATTVHNLFLLIAAESGLFAMVAFILFWLLILRKVFNLLMLEKKDFILLALAFFMSLVGFFIIHQVDPSYRFYPAIQRLIWLIAGLIIAVNRVAQEDNKKVPI